MKKFFLTFALVLTSLVSANAMSYEQARDQALFLTDKMAYELNLNEQQYEAAYEINLDYLMGVTTVDDVYAASWRQRNLDMQYIMLDWQYSAFCAAAYFFRPLYWNAGCWHFGIYAHYPHRDFFYYSRPVCYVSYRGGHSWRYNGGRSWYVERTVVYRGSGSTHHGMREVHAIGLDRSYRTNSGVRGASVERRGNVTERRGNSISSNRGNSGASVNREHSGVNSNREHASGTYNRGNRDNSTSSYVRGNRDHSSAVGNVDNTSSYNRGNRDNATSSYNRGSSTRTTVDRQASGFSGSRGSSYSGASMPRSNSFSSGNSTRSTAGFSGGSRSAGGFSHGGGHSGGSVSRGGGFSGGGHGGRR